jgi:hypothetical protein
VVNLFVVGVVSDPARTEDVRRAIVDAHRRTTPFAAEAHETSLFEGEHTVAASFSIHADETTIGRYSQQGDATFDTFAGLPRLGPLAAGRPWAEALAAARDAGTFDPDELGGVWALARAGRHEVELHGSSTGSEQLIMARRPGLVLVGNRASLVRLATWPEFPLAYDTDALTTLCTRGWLAHDRLPFSGLELLPPGVHVQLSPDGVRIDRRRGALPGLDAGAGRAGGHGSTGEPDAPADTDDTSTEVAAVYDTVAAELVAAAEEAGRVGGRAHLELTGDLNTRLSAAVYAAAGVEVTCVTPHAPDEAHGRVAAEVATAIGAEHVCEPVGPAGGSLRTQLDVQVLQGEGVSSVFDPCPPRSAEPQTQVVRHAAGALLGGYDNLASGPRPPIEDVEQGRRFLDDLTLHNSTLLLREEARTAQEQVNRRTAEELLDEVGPLSFHELAYLRLREGRGTGANRHAAAFGALQFAPMLDDRVLRHLDAIPLAHKRSQRAAFELIDRLAPRLARIRFVGSRWRFEQDGPGSLLEADTYDDRAPLPPDDGPGAAGRWRVGPDGGLPAVLRKRLAEPNRLLDEIVDRRRLEAALQTSAPVGDRDLRSLYGALTAAHLLGDEWLPKVRRAGRRAKD